MRHRDTARMENVVLARPGRPLWLLAAVVEGYCSSPRPRRNFSTRASDNQKLSARRARTRALIEPAPTEKPSAVRFRDCGVVRVYD